jgi:hypothetical protein
VEVLESEVWHVGRNPTGLHVGKGTAFKPVVTIEEEEEELP